MHGAGQGRRRRPGSKNRSSGLVARLHGLPKVRRSPQTRRSECIVAPRYVLLMMASYERRGRRLARVAGARGAYSSVMVATAAACPRGPPERKIAPRPARPTRYDRAAARDGGRNDPAPRRSSAGARTCAFRSQQLRTGHALGGRRQCARLAVRAQAGAPRRPPRALLATDARQQLLSHRASCSRRSSSPARRGLAHSSCGLRRWTRSSAASCAASIAPSAVKKPILLTPASVFGRHRTGAVRRRKFTARRRTAARPPAWWLVVSCATRTPPGALWSRSAARNASRQKNSPP